MVSGLGGEVIEQGEGACGLFELGQVACSAATSKRLSAKAAAYSLPLAGLAMRSLSPHRTRVGVVTVASPPVPGT
ncbi:hypothetical protein GCM10009540_20150 [Streptomyces turgidiscabies]